MIVLTPQPKPLKDFTPGNWFRNEASGHVYLVANNMNDGRVDIISPDIGRIIARTSPHYHELENSATLYPVDATLIADIPAKRTTP